MKWKVLLLGLFLTTGTLLAQEKKRIEAKLVRTFYKGDFLHANNEAALDLQVWAKGADDRVAVRICSKEPMPLALALASGRPFLLVSNLTNQGYSLERILFLRSEECSSNDSSVAVTEFWAIPKGAALPPSIESIKASQVKAEEDLTKEGDDNEERSYNRKLQDLATELYAKPDAVGIVVGYYLKTPSPSLKRRLDEAQKFLMQSGLSRNRYFIRSAPWTGIVDSDDPEPEYPDVVVIEVTKDCKQK